MSKFNQNTIHDASAKEVRKYALEVCGLEFSEDDSRNKMIQAVFAAEGWLEADPSETATHVEILIAREAGVSGNHAYRGGFNGEQFSIPRDIPTVIPKRYYTAIQSAQLAAGFTIAPLTDMREMDVSNARIPSSAIPVTVLRWIEK